MIGSIFDAHPNKLERIEANEKPVLTENEENRAELPDDSGERRFDVELPDDSGERRFDLELPDDSGEKIFAPESSDGGDNYSDISDKQQPDMSELKETEPATKDVSESNNDKSDVDNPDPVADIIAKSIGSPDGIKALIDKYPEKAELWKSQLEALKAINDPNASPVEIRSAAAKLKNLKGQVLEFAVKNALSEVGFDVEAQQRIVNGASGGTRPDVIALNNTDQPIIVFGQAIQPGETISVECKCGASQYMKSQLYGHIPNQLSGQKGTKVLLTTSDVNGTPEELVTSVCAQYGAKLVALDVSAFDVEKTLKEVAGE